MRCLYDGIHPCGKCPACLANRQRAFMFRLDQEKDSCSFYYWLTLTYSDEHVPFIEGPEGLEMCFNQEHCREFFEKLRKRYSKYGNTFKHFLVSEYGPNSTCRPHYHCLLLVYNKKSSSENYVIRKEMRDFILHTSWPYGHVTEKAYHGRVLRYLTKYCSKPELIGQNHFMKPFTLISRGIGMHFFEKISEVQKKQMIDKLDFTYWYNGSKITLPRYYVDKMLPHSAELLRQSMPSDPVKGDWSEYERIKSIRDRLNKKNMARGLTHAQKNIFPVDTQVILNNREYQMAEFVAVCKKRKNL